ncbi:glycerate kinase [Aestuariirhabdus litorea]|uniref:Glycerate kinase n=1 Tax=Aestuariirhabdus litorea TaxID=2528527 RepID=A0A3P3VPC4_9GAMM|nr:glycerate kinase [Aestuariirhabdus litorea]RRJ84450.1 glycerate kinase [Aestuariirhabdus litorea]RWW97674.1 glycerate kinase [Endozoicomonadaceae bacterium GTF-13]
MKILLAPDSFKGSLSAAEFCTIARRAILAQLPSAIVHSCPLADGGEGTVDALIANTQGERIRLEVTGPLGDPVEASYGILGDGTTAVIEMASASGLPLVPPKRRDPMLTTTFGTGELMRDALSRGCTHLILGIGGSATHDAGAGALSALGALLLDAEGKPIGAGAKGLLTLNQIDLKGLDPRLQGARLEIACDVANPLLGRNGATAVYAPQKGAGPEQMAELESALERFVTVACRDCHLPAALFDQPGCGAAGGLGAGLTAALGATLKPGFPIIADALGLEERLERERYDLIITGEGEINSQTLEGKLPVGVARLAAVREIPVIAVVGNIGEGAERTHSEGIGSIHSIVPGACSLEAAMSQAPQLLERCVGQLIRLWRLAKES